MSLRYASRLVYQVSMRALQGMKDQVSKCDQSIINKSLRDYSTCSSKQTRRLSGALDSTAARHKAAKSSEDKRKQAEESLRTVMYLSCWGPN